MSPSTVSPPLTLGACATLACIWEATAPKPGNVYRGADFEDLSYVDFLTSAAIVGPVIERAVELGVGRTVLEAVRATRAAVATNTNLGMLLLLAPLAVVPVREMPVEGALAGGIGEVLGALDREDAKHVFEGIRVAQPGGLGRVEEADVSDDAAPEISLVAAMRLAADRDLVACQYTNNFQQVFETANRIEKLVQRDWPLGDAIVHAFLQLLAEHPDSLIARKCGVETAQAVSTQAAAVLGSGRPGNEIYADEAYQNSVHEFDFALRTDGHRRNPGTSADLIAAALFVLLRENRLTWPVKFYPSKSTL